MAGRAGLGLFSVCVGFGDSCSHLMIPLWYPATLPIPRVFLSWLFSFSTSILHVLKISGITKAPAVFLQKKPTSLTLTCCWCAAFSAGCIPGCFPREFPQGFKWCGVFGSEELPALHLQPGGSRAAITAGPTRQLITAAFILTDALPRSRRMGACCLLLRGLYSTLTGVTVILGRLGTSELRGICRNELHGPEWALDPSTGGRPGTGKS